MTDDDQTYQNSTWCSRCERGVPVEHECPYKDMCMYCKKRPATLHFGDMLSITHFGSLNCCELCCAEKQLEHALEMAALVPERSAKVEELRAQDANQ